MCSKRGIPEEPPSPDKADPAEIAFRLYDKDKDGYITKGEMNKLAKNLTRKQIDKVRILLDRFACVEVLTTFSRF